MTIAAFTAILGAGFALGALAGTCVGLALGRTKRRWLMNEIADLNAALDGSR
ncbi:hypothetical protein [Salinarimonas sp.]|uniref:hypothetical protein n=1 Tax=Salinarimonas sp. TaxID=2766526 RepID=UPI00391C0CA5